VCAEPCEPASSKQQNHRAETGGNSPPLPRLATAGRSGGAGLRLRRKLRSREPFRVDPPSRGLFTEARSARPNLSDGSVVSSICRLKTSSWKPSRTRSRHTHVMEQWQRLGFESFGAWRRACEQDRRKQRSATKLAVATRPRVQWQPTTLSHDVRRAWAKATTST
jgi:hypothetical protein